MKITDITLDVVRNEETEIDILSAKIMFTYIYGRRFSYHRLTDDERKGIYEWLPRYQSEHFPDEYPDEAGYTGDYWDVYRGMYFESKEKLAEFVDTINDGHLTTTDLTSWSIDEKVAEEFAQGVGVTFYEHKEKAATSPVGIVLRIEHLHKEQVFFSSHEAHNAFDHYLSDFEEWTKKTGTFERENEFILLPGTQQVTIKKIIEL